MIKPFFILSAALLATACSSSNSGKPRIYTERFHPQLQEAVAIAEEKTGMKLNQPGLNILSVQFEEGTHLTACGWKGKYIEADGVKGIEGGYFITSGNVTLYLTDGELWRGDWRCRQDVHEMAHWIYYTHSISSSKHHDLMREKGFDW